MNKKMITALMILSICTTSSISPLATVKKPIAKPVISTTVKYKDGSVYTGQTLNGKKEGKGVLILKDIKYVGMFKNNMKCGYGEEYKKGVITYKGNWKNNKPDGYGEQYIDGKLDYKGNWKNDYKSGYGVSYFDNKINYKGNFELGRWNGKGTTFFESFGADIVHTGNFKNDSYTGNGVEQYSIGKSLLYTLTGTFKGYVCILVNKIVYENGNVLEPVKLQNYENNPNNIVTLTNGTKVKGTISELRAKGYIGYLDCDGYYIGEMSNNKKNGKGKLILNNGDIYVGEFKDALQNGDGIYIYADGTKVEGKWVNGLLQN